MKKIVIILNFCIAFAAGVSVAHHPAEDIVDAEIYDMIDEMVADTPHATLEFDDMNNTTTITADSVSAAENLINDGLLADLSLLDDDVTVTISFGETIETEVDSTENPLTGESWTEMNDWGRPVIFTVDTLLQ